MERSTESILNWLFGNTIFGTRSHSPARVLAHCPRQIFAFGETMQLACGWSRKSIPLYMISIIIPTLNEENYLPISLNSIRNQNFQNFEIIVADAGSKDKTLEMANNFGCKIAKGGLPAKGRNEGAKTAKGDLFLFLDADTILPENFFEEALKEFKERNLDLASFCLEAETKSKFKKFLFDAFYNFPILILEKFLAHGAQAILVKKEIFEKVGGFDEEIKFAEDHSFMRKAKKFGKFGILRKVRVFSSLRRFEKEGFVKTYLKYLLAEIYMIFFGDIKKDIFKYKFGNFNQ